MTDKKIAPPVANTVEANNQEEYITTKDKRARNFACVVYPESAPADWLNTLSEAKIAVLVSPLHDKDKNPGGEDKKAHFHVLTLYEGKKTMEQAKEFFSKIGGVGIEVVQSIRGYARYLCHLDNPEKYQYPVEDVQAFGGVDYLDIIGLPIDRYKAIREMMEFCEDNEVYSFYELTKFASESRFDWFRILCDSGAVIMREYLKSKSWTYQRK